jgi:hypothetical protein
MRARSRVGPVGAPAPAPPQIALVARRELSGNLYCQFEVFGAQPSPQGPRVVAPSSCAVREVQW